MVEGILVIVGTLITLIGILFPVGEVSRPQATDLVHYVDVESNLSEESEWLAYEFEAYQEYADEFTALFDSYETKRAKNGALMIRQGNSGSFKFAKKG